MPTFPKQAGKLKFDERFRDSTNQAKEFAAELARQAIEAERAKQEEMGGGVTHALKSGSLVTFGGFQFVTTGLIASSGINLQKLNTARAHFVPRGAFNNSHQHQPELKTYAKKDAEISITLSDLHSDAFSRAATQAQEAAEALRDAMESKIRQADEAALRADEQPSQRFCRDWAQERRWRVPKNTRKK